jgi:transposase
MARSLKVRKPTKVEMRKLQTLLENTEQAGRRRRAEVLLLYGAGLSGTAIAAALAIHPNTVYADLHAFAWEGLDCLRPGPRPGPKPEITPEQIAQIQALAETPPYTLGLPYGSWSLATLRDLVTQPPHPLVKHLSLEYLRQLLKRGAFTSGVCSTKSSAKIHNGLRFWPAFVRPGGICRLAASCCSSTLSRSTSKHLVAGAIRRPSAWSCRVTRKRGASSICSPCTRSIPGTCAGCSCPARIPRTSVASCAKSVAGILISRSGWCSTRIRHIPASPKRPGARCAPCSCTGSVSRSKARTTTRWKRCSATFSNAFWITVTMPTRATQRRISAHWRRRNRRRDRKIHIAYLPQDAHDSHKQ